MYYEDIRVFMDNHINWLSKLNQDIELFASQNFNSIIDLKNFFKYPNQFFGEFIETYDDYMKMRYSLARNCETRDIHINMEQYCRQFVLYLEKILRFNYKIMTEKTFEKQLIINRLFNKKHCFDLRDEVKSYLFNDSTVIYDSFFNETPKYYSDVV